MAQLVDPFIPAAPRPRPQPVRQARQAVHAARPAHGGISIDGVLPARAPIPRPSYRPPAGPLHLQYMPRPAAPAPKPSAMPARPVTTAQAVKSPHTSKGASKQDRRFTWEKKEVETKKVSTWALLGVVAIASLALFSVEIGQIALAVYAIVALWRRWPSQQTFALALAMFGGIIITQLIEPFQEVSNNLAVYAFLLLCIGVVALAREVRRDSREEAYN